MNTGEAHAGAGTSDAAAGLATMDHGYELNVFDDDDEGFDDEPDPLRLVRWPDLSVALVRASNERHLEDSG